MIKRSYLELYREFNLKIENILGRVVELQINISNKYKIILIVIIIYKINDLIIINIYIPHKLDFKEICYLLPRMNINHY